MKSTELMIGDWVYQAQFVDLADPNLGHGWKPVKVTSIPFDKDCFIEPIPLTAEKILERNGFRNNKLSYDDGDYYYYIRLEDVVGGIWAEVVSSRNVLHGRKVFSGLIKYVHELQHALRLCGIEKEIEL